jgi:preprotein translocase subunit SecF
MSQKYNFKFSQKFPMAITISLAMVIGSIVLFFTKGLNYGVDFRGGAEIQIKFEKQVAIEEIRKALESKNNISSIQGIGQDGVSEYLIKVAASDADINKVTDAINSQLQTSFSGTGLEILKTDIVGPKAGEQLRISGFQAMLWAMLAIMIYIGLRFDFKYAPGAIFATFHDVIIIIGVFILFNKEFSLQIVGALLAVIGYSVNDTVVIYDRVREHDEISHSGIRSIIDRALNETLSRTILTSLTTLFVSVTMLVMGGGVIHDFFFAITLGVIIGTYSSLFVAAPITLFFEKFTAKV